MNNFDKVAKKLGWKKPYKEVPLWYHKLGNGYIAKFSINNAYEIFEDYPEVQLKEETVESMFDYFSGNIFSQKHKKWILPMLASDYYYHKGKSEDKELEYARLAISKNASINFSNFGKHLKDKL